MGGTATTGRRAGGIALLVGQGAAGAGVVRRCGVRLAVMLSLLAAVATAVALPAPRVAAQSACVVTTAADSGAGSLREKVGLANAAGCTMDTITFDPGVTTVTLTSGELTLARSVTINGLSGGTVTVQRDASAGRFRIFTVNSGVMASLSNLTITGGFTADGSFGGASGGSGGGISNGGTVTLTNSTVSGNTTGNGGSGGFGVGGVGGGGGGNGGGISNSSGGTVTLTNSTVSGNTTGNGGSGVGVGGGFSGNGGSGGSGGGISNGGTVTLTNSTVSGNITGSGGSGSFGGIGGIGGGISNGGTLNATNSIIAGNTGSNVGGTNTSGTNNLTSGNPLLAPLGNYGGPTQTQPPLPGSPAIDAGSNAVCAAAPVGGVDQRGVPRPQNTTCDIGAVESRGFTLAATSGTPQSTPVGGPFTALTATLAGGMGDPVGYGPVTFTLPGSGASGVFGPTAGCTNSMSNTVATCTVSMGGVATSPTITANTTAGMYTATATTAGVTTGATYALTNTEPDLTITKTHTSTFTQGQTGATYTITVTNSGTGATSGTVNVTDAVPTGLTATALSGTGWTCLAMSFTCTRTDALAPMTSYPAITLTVDVAANAPASVTNTATVSGGGETNTMNNTANDVTAVVAPPNLSINDVRTNEGNSGTTMFTFTVSLSSPAPTGGATFDIATANGTAVAPGDYTARSLTGQTIPAGMSMYLFTVLVTGDTANEPNETFTVNVTNVTGASVIRGQGQGTITNDDALPTVSIGNVTQAEGNSGTTAFAFTVTLSAASGQTVTVAYATANGTATAGSDYTATNGTLTFAPGETTKTITVNVNGDTANEPDETFTVGLSGATNATISTATGTGTITNDDMAVTLSPATLPSGTAGVAYSQTLTATGGTGYTFAVSAGSLPAGLMLAANGTLSGTPMAVAMSTFTVRATDTGMNTATRQYTVTIGAASVTSIAATRQSGGMGSGNTGSAVAGTTVQLALVATFSDGSTQPVPSGATWTSGDSAKATVDGTGRVSTLSSGTVVITAVYLGQTTTFTLVVTAPGTGGLMPNPAPVVRPADAPTVAAPVLPAPPMRAAAPGGIGAQGSGEATPTPRPAPPMR